MLENKQSARICSQVAGPRLPSDFEGAEIVMSSVDLIPRSKRKTAWSIQEVNILRENYYMGLTACMTLLPNRTRCAIQMRASLMGLYVDPLYSRRSLRTRAAREEDKRSQVAEILQEQKSLHHRSNFGYTTHDTSAYGRLAALLTQQMEAQSKRWGFPVGHMDGRIKGQRIGVVNRDKDSDAT